MIKEEEADSAIPDLRAAAEAGASWAKNSSQLDGKEAGEVGKEAGKPCVPMIMHIDLPEPLSQKTLILGEPVLQKYYTAFDAAAPRVGFVAAKHADPIVPIVY